MEVYSVYMHTSPSGKRYIGITKQKPTQRWGKGKNYKSNTYFTGAIEKYGWDNFTHEILYEVNSLDEAKALEIDLIAKYQSDNRDFGYNLSKGGEPCNKGLTREDKRKRDNARTRQWAINHPERRKEIERKSDARPERKARQNELNKTPKRREHRTEYMRKYRETHREKMREISHKAYLKRTGRLEEGEQCTS